MAQVNPFFNPRSARLGWIIWLTLTAAISLLVWRSPAERNISHHYRTAAENWSARQGLYTFEDIEGFLYFPQAGILWIPFTWPPYLAGELLWRWVSIGLFAAAIYRLAELIDPGGKRRFFLLLSLLAIPAALGSARNGQMNVILAATMIHATVDLARQRWWGATAWLCLSVALKPLALVMVLLVGVVYWRPMAWRLAVGLAVTAALPLALAPPAYALEQYQACWRKMGISSRPGARLFTNLNGLLAAVKIDLPERAFWLLRTLAAPATLALAWLGRLRWGAVRGAVLLWTLAVVYLMLFSPRTEATTYVLLSPAVAVFACWALASDRWPAAGIMLLIVEIGIGAGKTIANSPKNYAVKPAMCVVFLAYLLILLARSRRPAEASFALTPEGQLVGGA